MTSQERLVTGNVVKIWHLPAQFFSRDASKRLLSYTVEVPGRFCPVVAGSNPMWRHSFWTHSLWKIVGQTVFMTRGPTSSLILIFL